MMYYKLYIYVLCDINVFIDLYFLVIKKKGVMLFVGDDYILKIQLVLEKNKFMFFFIFSFRVYIVLF